MLVACVLAGACAGAYPEPSMQSKPPSQAAREFLPRVEQALAGLAIRQNGLRVRANPCEGPSGQVAEDRYYVWVGLQGEASAGDAAAVIDDAHQRWQDAGWQIARYRALENGGRNLAATDPDGNTYVIDSGFRNAPASALAGFFNTPCLQSPDGAVAYGDLPLPG